MSVDVEDYFHVSVFDDVVPRSQWDQMDSRVVPNTTRLLDLFDEFGVRGTFFVLGWVAERHPDLVRAIAARGHEVASHGYGHRSSTTRRVPRFARTCAREAAARGHHRPRRQRLPRAEFLGDGAVALGAGCADGGGLPLRRQHLPHPARSLRDSIVAAAPVRDRAKRQSAERSAWIDGARRTAQPAGRRRRLLSSVSLRLDPLGRRSPQRARAASRRLLHPSLGNRSGPAAASGQLAGTPPSLPQPRQDRGPAPAIAHGFSLRHHRVAAVGRRAGGIAGAADASAAGVVLCEVD